MKRLMTILSTILFSVLIFSEASFPQALVPYDDFSGTYIDRTKWIYGELVREISGGKLVLKQASPNPFVATSFPYIERNSLTFSDPISVSSIQADVTLLEAAITNSARIAAMLGGRWYRVGPGTPGDLTGDIHADISLRKEPSELKANWRVLRFTNAQGTTWDVIKSGDFTTTINIGPTDTYNLYIGYDSVANQFVFRIGSEEITCGPADGLPVRFGDPSGPWKAIHNRVQIDDAASSGYIVATFDNVYKNGALYDDFSSPTIDSTKWTAYEFVREISNGKLRTKVRTGSASSNDSVNSDLPSIIAIKAAQAKVTLLDLQNPQGLYERVGITGAFYNDGTPGEWQIGDVQAVVRIVSTWLTLQPEWEVLRCADSECDNTETLATGVFTTPIVLGNTYTLFIEWDGSQFTLKFNDEVAHYTPTSILTINPAKLPFIDLNTKVHPSPDYKKATIEALYDDVFVNGATLTTPVLPADGGSIGLNPPGGTYDWGTVVTLTANPADGYQFDHWEGDLTGSTNPAQITMDGNKTVTAVFLLIKVEEDNPAITYTGTWNTYTSPSCSGGAMKYSGQKGAKAEFSFTGTGIKWIVTKAMMMGKAKVYLDGGYMGLVDLYSSSPAYQVVLQKTGLAPGNHTLRLEVSGQKNLRATGYYINIDAFEVIHKQTATELLEKIKGDRLL